MNKVILEIVPDSCNKLSLLKIVNEITNLGLESAKNIIDNAPSILFEDISTEDALLIKKIIEDAGARVTLVGFENQESNCSNENIPYNTSETDKDSKLCPFCGETIKVSAKKCKHCGEWLNKENKSIISKTNVDTSSVLKYGPCRTVMSIINFAILIFAFVDNSFGDFFWSNFIWFCVWAGVSSATANAIDESMNKKNKG